MLEVSVFDVPQTGTNNPETLDKDGVLLRASFGRISSLLVVNRRQSAIMIWTDKVFGIMCVKGTGL